VAGSEAEVQRVPRPGAQLRRPPLPERLADGNLEDAGPSPCARRALRLRIQAVILCVLCSHTAAAAINKALARSSPTVFINACRRAGLNATYNRLDGWAIKFLEAEAVPEPFRTG
jgi:hypothetical protein